MSDLKHTSIGGKNIVLKKVPARDARKIQTMLIAMVAEPLADALGQESTKKKTPVKTSSKEDKSKSQGENILAGIRGIAGILPKLNDGELDLLIDQCKPFILVEGKQFDENAQFDADTLFDMYEVLWYFLRETFGGFMAAVRLRFPQLEAMTALKK